MTISLNYMWIQPKKLDLEENPAGYCPIPERFVKRALDVAIKHPDVEVSIWYDFYGVGENKPSITKALNAYNLPSNVRFRSLDEIPAFKTDPLFLDAHTIHRGYNSPVWSQTDYIRMEIIDKVLYQRNPQYSHVMYADMDFGLTRKTFDTLKNKGMVLYGDASDDSNRKSELQREGFFLSAASEYEDNFDFNDPSALQSEEEDYFFASTVSEKEQWYIENGLVGFSRELRDVWRKEILPVVRDASDAMTGEERWSKFVTALYNSSGLEQKIGRDLRVVFTDEAQLETQYSDYTHSNSTFVLEGLSQS